MKQALAVFMVLFLLGLTACGTQVQEEPLDEVSDVDTLPEQEEIDEVEGALDELEGLDELDLEDLDDLGSELDTI